MDHPMFELIDGKTVRLDPIALAKRGPGHTLTGYMTREIAAYVLKHMMPNRRERPRQLRDLVRKMQAKQFLHSPDNIGWDVNGQANNGMHRSLACIQTNTRFLVQMSFGWPVRTQDIVDIGAKRTSADQGNIAGIKYSSHRIAAIRLITIYAGGSDLQIMHKEIADFQRLVKEFDETVELCMIENGLSIGTGNAAFMAAMTLAYRRFPDKASMFIEQVKKQENLTSSDPAYKCLRFLRGGQTMDQRVTMVGRVLSAFEAFRAGNKPENFNKPVPEKVKAKYLEGLNLGYFAQTVEIPSHEQVKAYLGLVEAAA